MSPSSPAGWHAVRRTVDPRDWRATAGLLAELLSGGIVVPPANPRVSGASGAGNQPPVWSIVQADGDIQTKIQGDPSDPQLKEALGAHLEEVAATLRQLAGLGPRILGLRLVVCGLGTAIAAVSAAARWHADPEIHWVIEASRAILGWYLLPVLACFVAGALVRTALKLLVTRHLRSIAGDLAATDNDQRRWPERIYAGGEAKQA